MQSDHKQIYKLTAERTQKSETIYKDIGNFVFSELNAMFRRPKSLIIKLKGVGYWFLRRKRLLAVIYLYPPDWEKKQEGFDTISGFLKNEDRKEIHTLFKERLKEYEEYAKLKTFIRQERNKTQVLLTPKRNEPDQTS